MPKLLQQINDYFFMDKRYVQVSRPRWPGQGYLEANRGNNSDLGFSAPYGSNLGIEGLTLVFIQDQAAQIEAISIT